MYFGRCTADTWYDVRMTSAPGRVDSRTMATPRPLVEVAGMLGVSRSTMWKLVRELKLTKYTVPGGGKTVHLDPDEVRRKRRHRPKPVEES